MKNLYIFLFLFFCFLFQLLRFFFIAPQTDYIELAITIIVVIFSLFAFLNYKEKYSAGVGQAFRISYFFLLGFLIVHFQMYIDYLLGNYGDFRNDYFLGGKYTAKASIVSSLGLISFLLGYIISIKNDHFSVKPSYLNVNSSKYMKFFSFICFVIFILSTNKSYFTGGYGSVELAPESVYAQTFFFYSIVAVIAIKTYAYKVSNSTISVFAYLKNIGLLFNILIFFYLMLVLLSGDRGPIIQISLLYFGGYVFSQNRKIKFIYILVLIIFASVFITFLGEVRSLSSDSSYSEKIQNVQSNSELRESRSSFSPNTHELAISVRTVHAALDYTNENGFGYGAIQLNQLVAIFPGVGRLIRSIFEFDNNQILSADIITSHMNQDHGMGTSTVTDLYLDLSIPGVVFGLFLFGIILRKADVISFTPYITSLFFWIVILILISRSIYIGRSSIMILIREIVMVYLLILACGGIRQKR